MRGLKITIIFKIIITILFWVIPSLFFSPSWNSGLGFPKLEPPVFIKLLGMAFTALCVGYVLGLREIKNGRYPALSVSVGIVSNGGAALVLAIYGIGGQWQDWGFPARIFMWSSLAAVSFITLGLAYFGVFNHYFKNLKT